MKTGQIARDRQLDCAPEMVGACRPPPEPIAWALRRVPTPDSLGKGGDPLRIAADEKRLLTFCSEDLLLRGQDDGSPKSGARWEAQALAELGRDASAQTDEIAKRPQGMGAALGRATAWSL